MSKISQEQVLEALSKVFLPAQKQSVVEQKLISRLELQEESFFIEYKLPAENKTFEKSLEYQTKKALQSLSPKLEVVVAFITDASEQKEEAPLKRPKIGSMIAVGSGKGGVGKSSVTVNLAIALKKMHYKVGILDCDIYGPSIPTMLGVEGKKPMMLDEKIQPIDAHGLKLMSAGFFIEEGQGLIWRGPMIHKLIQQFYMDVDWEGTDVLLIDLPPGTGDAPLSLAQTMPLTGALLVSLPQRVSIVDVQKANAMFQQVKIPVLGAIENMSEFVCPSCEHHEPIFGAGGVEDFSQKNGIPFLGRLPLDPKLRRLCDEGKPYLLEAEKTAAGQAFMQVAERLTPVLKTADEEDDGPVKLVL